MVGSTPTLVQGSHLTRSKYGLLNISLLSLPWEARFNTLPRKGESALRSCSCSIYLHILRNNSALSGGGGAISDDGASEIT